MSLHQGSAAFTQESCEPNHRDAFPGDNDSNDDSGDDGNMVVFNGNSLLQNSRARDFRVLKAMINQKMKEINNLCGSTNDTSVHEKFLDGLLSLENEVFGTQLDKMSAKRKRALEGGEGDMISYLLPVDVQRRSTQMTYRRRK